MMNAWNVFMYGTLIDTVYYQMSFDKDSVKNELVRELGYPADITIKRVVK
jgi:hypothetical protein